MAGPPRPWVHRPGARSGRTAGKQLERLPMGSGSSPNGGPSAILAAKPDAPCRVASRRASLCRVAPSRLSLQANAGKQVLISLCSPGNLPASGLGLAHLCSRHSCGWKSQRDTWPEALEEQGPDSDSSHTQDQLRSSGDQAAGHGEVDVFFFLTEMQPRSLLSPCIAAHTAL